ncbi:hypothetical protein EJD97_003227 [Solanum chilense]|uniref:Uncharacterized protein n=1 Tax=Solanum chilense TaxID=4083 RepID=A0A6N2AMM3_SOLCI|nr:hypothetical protein EJD97_003227 [Solanum chilense]
MAPPKAVKQTVAAVAQTAAPEASNPTTPSGIYVPEANMLKMKEIKEHNRCVHYIMELMSIFQESFKEIIHSCSVSLVSGSLIPPGALVFNSSRAAVCATAATCCFTTFGRDIPKVFVVPRIWMALSSS